MAFKNPDPTADYHQSHSRGNDIGSKDFEKHFGNNREYFCGPADRVGRATGNVGGSKDINRDDSDGIPINFDRDVREELEVHGDIETGFFTVVKTKDSPISTQTRSKALKTSQVLTPRQFIRAPENYIPTDKTVHSQGSSKINTSTNDESTSTINQHRAPEASFDSTKQLDKQADMVGAVGATVGLMGSAMLLMGGPATALAAFGWSLTGLGWSGAIAAASMNLASAGIKVSEGNYTEAGLQIAETGADAAIQFVKTASKAGDIIIETGATVRSIVVTE